MSEGDCLRVTLEIEGRPPRLELGFRRTDAGESETVVWERTSRELPGMRFESRRDGAETAYDVSIPLAEIGLSSDNPAPESLRVALKLDDADGEGRDLWIGLEHPVPLAFPSGNSNSNAMKESTFDIRSFGAAESAAPAQNAAAIQRALDAAGDAASGRVVVPPGTFVSGTIWLRPHVELHLEEGAVLKASPDLSDYNAPDAYPENWGCPPEYWNGCHFIIARKADGASITGPGTIDGNGDAFFDDEPIAYYDWMKQGASAWWNGIRWAKDKENLRPGQLVAFVKCRDVAVRGVTIRNSPCWSLWFWGCEGVRVSDYTVRNGENDGNTDGIDIDCSRDVVLEHADIDTGDDAIAIRASARESAPTEQGRLGLPSVTDGVRVRGCKLRSTSSVFRIGVGEGVVRNVLIEDVTCDRGGTAVNISTLYGPPEGHGTDIEDVTVRNCRFTGCRVGAAVRSNGGDRLESGIRRIRFENCSFGGLAPVLESAPGVRFPLTASDVVFAD